MPAIGHFFEPDRAFCYLAYVPPQDLTLAAFLALPRSRLSSRPAPSAAAAGRRRRDGGPGADHHHRDDRKPASLLGRPTVSGATRSVRKPIPRSGDRVIDRGRTRTTKSSQIADIYDGIAQQSGARHPSDGEPPTDVIAAAGTLPGDSTTFHHRRRRTASPTVLRPPDHLPYLSTSTGTDSTLTGTDSTGTHTLRPPPGRDLHPADHHRTARHRHRRRGRPDTPTAPAPVAAPAAAAAASARADRA